MSNTFLSTNEFFLSLIRTRPSLMIQKFTRGIICNSMRRSFWWDQDARLNF
jgi:hypothetical protein